MTGLPPQTRSSGVEKLVASCESVYYARQLKTVVVVFKQFFLRTVPALQMTTKLIVTLVSPLPAVRMDFRCVSSLLRLA